LGLKISKKDHKASIEEDDDIDSEMDASSGHLNSIKIDHAPISMSSFSYEAYIGETSQKGHIWRVKFKKKKHPLALIEIPKIAYNL
jgi:hypothetical protein